MNFDEIALNRWEDDGGAMNETEEDLLIPGASRVAMSDRSQKSDQLTGENLETVVASQ
jgi:hypothetical protein